MTFRDASPLTEDVGAQHVRRLAEGTRDIVFFRYLFGPPPGYAYISPGIEDLVGYPAQAFYDDPYLTYKLLHPDDVAKLQLVRDEGSRGQPGVHILRARHRDGHEIWTEQRSVPILDADGRHIGFEAIAVDITARVAAEERTASRERHFRSLVRNSSDMVFITDEQGTLLDATPSVRAILGYDPTELVGQSRFDFFHPDDKAEALAKFASHISAGPGHDSRTELRVANAAGEWRWIECTATNLLDDPDVRGIVINARDVTERRQLVAQLERHANTDVLTGLMNWRRFMERLEERISEHDPSGVLAIVVLGLNRFGAINDTLGYQYGDRLLQQVAQRLSGCSSGDAEIGRGNGKRFALSFAAQNSGATAQRVAAIQRAFDEPFVVDGEPLQVDATLGYALFPTDGDSPELLLRRAEVSRRRALRAGAPFLAYVPDLGGPGAPQIRLLGQLREALDRGELELHYQPKVDLDTGRLVGVEALVRWHHAERGWVNPGEFIPLAEESGLIRPLTSWVVQAAVEQAARWQADGLWLPVSANITARNLHDPAFVKMVAEAIEIGLPASDLVLELTERSVMTDPVASEQTCRRLKDLGVQLSLDDFGTGHSALAYLARLPIDEIKIDRTFVMALAQRPEARAIVRALVELARDLDKAVVAEGVEDQPTADLLQTLACATMQGFHFGRPMPATEVPRWLAQSDWIAGSR